MAVKFETWRLNIWNVVIIALSIAVNAAWAGYIWSNTQRDIQQVKEQFANEAADRKDQQHVYQQTMDSVNVQVGKIQPLQMQQDQMLEKITENKSAIAAANARIDRVVESFGGKLDTVIDNVGKISTQVQVLSSKLDDIQGRGEKTIFRTPIVRP